MLSIVKWVVLREDKFSSIYGKCLMQLFGEGLIAITQVSKVILWLYFFREKLIWGLLVFRKLLFKAAHQNIIPVSLHMLCFSLCFCSFVCHKEHQRQLLNFNERSSAYEEAHRPVIPEAVQAESNSQICSYPQLSLSQHLTI